MSNPRPYRSPLRQKQAGATRTQILEALIDMVNEVGASDLNIKDLAKRAGVSERTVYRHFADRRALVDGLFDHIDERADWPDLGTIEHVDQLPAILTRSYLSYDDHERETRALVLMNLDPGRTASVSQAHVAQSRELVARSFPDLAQEEAAGIGAMLNLLGSSRTWLRLLDGHGMSGRESARFVGWAVELIVAELRAGHPVPPAAVAAAPFTGDDRADGR